jgi:hypothetical protein
MSKFCERCGVECEEKLYIQVNKRGDPKLFCPCCFYALRTKTSTEINKELRKRRKHI